MNKISELTTIKEIINLNNFKDFGHLLFPLDRPIHLNMTLRELSTENIFIWYSHIKVAKTIEIIETLNKQANNHQIFYPIYSEKERQLDPTKNNTGIFFFKGKDNAPYAICNAGGGFMYVGAMHDSFPHALEINKRGYNAFVLIYRVEHAYEDLAKAITFIYNHSDELKVARDHYSLWGGSAGARMAAVLGNKRYLFNYTNSNIPQAEAVIMQYTGYNYVSKDDACTYVNVGTNDYIASWHGMKQRVASLNSLGINSEFHCYQGLSHGYGLGIGTRAEGWIDDALAFWKRNTRE